MPLAPFARLKSVLKPSFVLLLASAATLCFGQDQQSPQGTAAQSSAPEEGGPIPNTLTSLAGEFFQHDFVNVYAFTNGLYDSLAQSYSPGSSSRGSVGVSLGGGINAFHQFRDSVFSVSYTGSWTDFNNGGYLNGENQNLALLYSKRLNARWSASISAFAGIYLYGGTFGTVQPNGSGTVVTNPFSPETKFAGLSLSTNYRQTRRLSYSFSVAGFLNRYDYAGSIGSTGITGTGSAIYQITARTSISGSYTQGYFGYQHGVGNSTVQGLYASMTHTFTGHWVVSVSGGATRTNAAGIITIPLQFISNGQPVVGYAIGRYRTVEYTPTFQGSVSHHFRRTDVSFSGGQGVVPGNGYYLTSRDIFFGGAASHSFLRRSNTSFGMGYNRLTSVSNTVTSTYSDTYIGGSFGYMLFRHVSAFARYNYFRYGYFSGLKPLTDNQIAFGLSFSSKSIPLTLY